MRLYDDAAFSPDCSIGYLIRRANQMGSARLEPVFVDEGMGLMHWSALVAIHFGRGDTAAELARDLGHDTGAMTRLIDVMEERGWLSRERHAGDRRRIHLKLTNEGDAVMRRCKTRVVEQWNDWLAEWSRDDADMLIALLQRLNATLAGREGPRA